MVKLRKLPGSRHLPQLGGALHGRAKPDLAEVPFQQPGMRSLHKLVAQQGRCGKCILPTIPIVVVTAPCWLPLLQAGARCHGRLLSATLMHPTGCSPAQNMGCTFSSQPLARAGAGEASPAPAAQGSTAPSLSSGTGLVTADSNAPQTNSASSRDSTWLDSFRAGDPSPTGPLLPPVGGAPKSAK